MTCIPLNTKMTELKDYQLKEAEHRIYCHNINYYLMVQMFNFYINKQIRFLYINLNMYFLMQFKFSN